VTPSGWKSGSRPSEDKYFMKIFCDCDENYDTHDSSR
jgi:hypothetical protein